MTAKLSRIAATAALGAALAVIVGALLVVTVVPKAVGGVALTVLTGSMSPAIPAGSVVVVQPVDARTLRVGDVITYQAQPGVPDFITHRITRLNGDAQPPSVTTQGDANPEPDGAPVPVAAIRGKVVLHVPHLGTVRNAIGIGASGWLLTVLGLAVYAAFQISLVARERRRRSGSARDRVGSATQQLRLQTLVVTFAVAQFEGLDASQVGRLLGAEVLDGSADQFTVAFVREPEQLDALAAAMLAFTPRTVTRSEVLHIPLCRTSVADSTSTTDVMTTSDGARVSA